MQTHLGQFVRRTSRCVLGIAALLAIDGGQPAAGAGLREALLLHASFDGRLDADVAAGDRQLYTAPTGNRAQARAGLPDGDLVVHVKGGGRFGDGLRFTRKMRPVVFYRGEKNLGYRTNDWSGSASFWLKLDPDKELEPGYCDPLQFVAQGWDEGNMFVEFSKDHTPRHFRYAIMPVKKSWNPTNRGWEDWPDKERPMVPVHRPPFTQTEWVHVCFVFTGINSGRADGSGRLYLNGRDQGAFTQWRLPFNWDESKSAVTIGLSYVGSFDDLAIFNRALTPAEVETIHQSANGIRGL